MTPTTDGTVFREIREVFMRANFDDLEMLDTVISITAVYACALGVPRETAAEWLGERMKQAIALDPRDRGQSS